MFEKDQISQLNNDEITNLRKENLAITSQSFSVINVSLAEKQNQAQDPQDS